MDYHHHQRSAAAAYQDYQHQYGFAAEPAHSLKVGLNPCKIIFRNHLTKLTGSYYISGFRVK